MVEEITNGENRSCQLFQRRIGQNEMHHRADPFEFRLEVFEQFGKFEFQDSRVDTQFIGGDFQQSNEESFFGFHTFGCAILKQVDLQCTIH